MAGKITSLFLILLLALVVLPLQPEHGVSANLATDEVRVVTTGSDSNPFTEANELLPPAPPSVTSVNPNSGAQGQTLDVTITGTNFTDANLVRFGGLGSYVSVNSFTVHSDTEITASITILSYASPGTRNVSVSSLAGTGSLNGGFTVARAGQQTQSVQTATGTGLAIFTTDGGSINNLTALDATPCGVLGGYTAPQGFFSFNITNLTPGSTVIITITFPSAIPADSQYWMCVNGQWVNVTSLVGHNDGDNILTLTLTDGGLADADGAANGTYVDPGGPAVAVSQAVQTGRSAGMQSSSPSIPAPVSQVPVGLPNIYVQNASLSAVRMAPGAELTVTAGVANRGTADGSATIKLYVNGVEDSSRGVTLESGDSRQVSFTLSRSQPGVYSVHVNGVPAGSFTVEKSIEVNLILLVSCALILIALILGYIYLSRRQKYIP